MNKSEMDFLMKMFVLFSIGVIIGSSSDFLDGPIKFIAIFSGISIVILTFIKLNYRNITYSN